MADLNEMNVLGIGNEESFLMTVADEWVYSQKSFPRQLKILVSIRSTAGSLLGSRRVEKFGPRRSDRPIPSDVVGSVHRIDFPVPLFRGGRVNDQLRTSIF